MIELHQLEKALEAVRKFNPTDQRMQLALHLGAYCVEKLHVTSAPEKKIAKEIVGVLEPRVAYMRPALVKELKGILLEVLNGKVEVLDSDEGAK